jgi:hypothetical protein
VIVVHNVLLLFYYFGFSAINVANVQVIGTYRLTGRTVRDVIAEDNMIGIVVKIMFSGFDMSGKLQPGFVSGFESI